MTAVAKAADAQDQAWVGYLQSPPVGDLAIARAELSTRADTLRGLWQTDYSRWCELMGETPNYGDGQ